MSDIKLEPHPSTAIGVRAAIKQHVFCIRKYLRQPEAITAFLEHVSTAGFDQHFVSRRIRDHIKGFADGWYGRFDATRFRSPLFLHNREKRHLCDAYAYSYITAVLGYVPVADIPQRLDACFHAPHSWFRETYVDTIGCWWKEFVISTRYRFDHSCDRARVIMLYAVTIDPVSLESSVCDYACYDCLMHLVHIRQAQLDVHVLEHLVYLGFWDIVKVAMEYLESAGRWSNALNQLWHYLLPIVSTEVLDRTDTAVDLIDHFVYEPTVFAVPEPPIATTEWRFLLQHIPLPREREPLESLFFRALCWNVLPVCLSVYNAVPDLTISWLWVRRVRNKVRPFSTRTWYLAIVPLARGFDLESNADAMIFSRTVPQETIFRDFVYPSEIRRRALVHGIQIWKWIRRWRDPSPHGKVGPNALETTIVEQLLKEYEGMRYARYNSECYNDDFDIFNTFPTLLFFDTHPVCKHEWIQLSELRHIRRSICNEISTPVWTIMVDYL